MVGPSGLDEDPILLFIPRDVSLVENGFHHSQLKDRSNVQLPEMSTEPEDTAVIIYNFDYSWFFHPDVGLTPSGLQKDQRDNYNLRVVVGRAPSINLSRPFPIPSPPKHL